MSADLNLDSNKKVTIDYLKIDNEYYYKITNSNLMRPFFMSIVSDSNHWMFISSNGGLSAGRKDSDHSLFPYYTDDKITESAEITGSKSIFRIHHNGKVHIWEPFSIRFQGAYQISRNLYKNAISNKIIFEEINHDLNLSFKYQWSSSNVYGFVKTSTLVNHSDQNVTIELLDGIQNVLPYGVGADLQNRVSNLVDAYKRSELETSSGMGIFALSAKIVDKAEPSEALKANLAWSIGLENPTYLLSSLQLDKFRGIQKINTETDIKAEKGAYFVSKEITLEANCEKSWFIIANVNQDHAAIVELVSEIKNSSNLEVKIKADVESGSRQLLNLNASSDGLQLTADQYRDTRHFSNTLFNIMRGGIFDFNYQIEKWDFDNYLAKANKKVYAKSQKLLQELPNQFNLSHLRRLATESTDPNFRRLCLEYMPLKFSRRHGDPSRPWNRFSINTRSEVDGSKILDYEGNWRDIFQNWEALAHAYPEFIDSMIHKFLNATTFDGYNPYRVTKDGFDWEVIEEHDPWSYIGYWGDHQIIYLLKFLEFIENHNPGQLNSYFDDDLFVYANVPYKIKSYQETLKNPKDTIDFDYDLDQKINIKKTELGADGALLRDQNYFIHKVNFVEKILATVLAKVSNFIPEGGIWLNTQRPEWNDANNALVGNGVSMVTLYYLRRFLKFLEQILEHSKLKDTEISEELLSFFNSTYATLQSNKHLLSGKISDKDRKVILDGLGTAGSRYRVNVYQNAFSGKKNKIAVENIKDFVAVMLEFAEHSIEANKRTDNLFHAYNLMTIHNDGIAISYLDEMLEGQVAVLSAGYLSAADCLKVLDAMKASKLFRPDQYSYILYPNKDLPKFTEKNNIPEHLIEESKLFKTLVAKGNQRIITKDINGKYHFNGSFNNANDLKNALNNLKDSEFGDLVKKETDHALKAFETVFNHKAFTGRSGTFYGYEGLGSIYWHMVSKLQLAVQECCLQAVEAGENEVTVGKLLEHYYEINEGIGVHKSPQLYGAFPTDPYSHTPAGKGVQQPGMTGQVKEDILSRIGELGVFVKDGCITFNPCLLRATEFLTEPRTYRFIDIHHNQQQISLQPQSLAFSYCQVPIIYNIADSANIEVVLQDNDNMLVEGLQLNKDFSSRIFNRTGEVNQLIVNLTKDLLK
ncbi:hypothetical protein FJ651_09880 [Paucihalobacter ruber]|uniref:Uncharacterized protein n=1 Tax=Paucihalobacter ruber TaxID=2567861 RepID=A0A506PIF3_9FLAO|nr:hypothetical protein [Paucihalobacter ruber]TPV33389.1 hypothetical protein FJ651_09880 [Paucihalobacter ruber]